MKQLALDLAVRTPTGLDDFIAGRNAEALQYLRGLLKSGSDERFVYLWGRPGSGRTHLLRAMTAAVQATGRSAVYVAGGTDSRLAEGASYRDCIVVDDVDRLPPSVQIEMFNVYNNLRDSGGMLLAAGDAPPAQLALRPDLVTRLAWGMVFQIHPLTDDDKLQALTAYAAARGFRLAAEVAEYLLRHTQRDLPALLALLDALDRSSLEGRRPVTIPLVRELLAVQSRTSPAGGRRVTDDT